MKIITCAVYIQEETMAPVMNVVVYKDGKFLLVTNKVSRETIQDISANSMMSSMEEVVSEFPFDKAIELTKEEVDEIYKDFFDSPDRHHPDNDIQREAKRFLLELRRNIKLNKLGI